MDYASWVQAWCGLLEYPIPDDATASTSTPTGLDIDTVIPRAIEYTELRIQRDLDLIGTTTTARGALLANQRLQTLPQVNIPAVGDIPVLLGTPVPPGSIVTTTNASMAVNVEWDGHGLTAGQMVSFLLPLPVGGITIGGDYSIITVVDANNFTINTSFNASANASAVVVGSGIYVVCTQISLVIGASNVYPYLGGVKQPPIEPVTRDFLDFAWPDDASLGTTVLPQQWCPNDQTNVLVGPAPPARSVFEAVGTMRIPQLSPTNYSNFLTQQFPDLYLTCSMVWFSGWQRDFGAQSEDPKLAQSWESQYQTLLSSAKVEESRKSFANMYPSPSNPSGLTAKSQGN